MVITKMSLPRRTFLRGVGATLALPMLDAMISALPRAAAPSVRRFGVVYVPNGMVMPSWTPKTVGAGFEFTPTLQPLEPFRDQTLVLTGLNGVRGGGAPSRRSEAFLTGAPHRGGRVGR